MSNLFNLLSLDSILVFLQALGLPPPRTVFLDQLYAIVCMAEPARAIVITTSSDYLRIKKSN